MADFIADATKNAHGQFRAKARRAGMSTAAFARHVLANKGKYNGRTRRQASLAKTLMRLGKH